MSGVSGGRLARRTAPVGPAPCRWSVPPLGCNAGWERRPGCLPVQQTSRPKPRQPEQLFLRDRVFPLQQKQVRVRFAALGVGVSGQRHAPEAPTLQRRGGHN